MKKTYKFKNGELSMDDTLIMLDNNEIAYDKIETVSYKQAVFGVKGELRVKSAGLNEEKLYFSGGINKEVRIIAGKIAKTAGIKLTVIKKSKSKLPLVLIPVCAVIVVLTILILIFYGKDKPSDDYTGNGNYVFEDNFNYDSENPGDIEEPFIEEPFIEEPFTDGSGSGEEEKTATEEISESADGDTGSEIPGGDELYGYEAEAFAAAVFQERLNAGFEAISSTLRADFPEADGGQTIEANIADRHSFTLRIEPDTSHVLGMTYVWADLSENAGTLEAFISMCVAIAAFDPAMESYAPQLLLELAEGDGIAKRNGLSYAFHWADNNGVALIIKRLN